MKPRDLAEDCRCTGETGCNVPAERPTPPNEVVATIFKSLGLNLETLLPGPAGRPFPLVDSGTTAIEELF